MAKEVSHNEIQQVAYNDASHILGAPRITEKAAMGTSEGVYTFNVPLSVNKIQVKQAVKALYNVEPVKVNIVRQRPTEKRFRGRKGTAKAYKKALVYLKEGDSIEL
jgi:large subunit ribosomal protein L23